jgi:hypothetical protein
LLRLATEQCQRYDGASAVLPVEHEESACRGCASRNSGHLRPRSGHDPPPLRLCSR